MKAAAAIVDWLKSAGSEDVVSDWFDGFYRSHHRAVRSLIFRMGAGPELDDLCQEVFLKAFRSRGSFRGDCEPVTWLLRIAVNTVSDFLRRKRRRPCDHLGAEIDLMHAGSGRSPYKSQEIGAALGRLTGEKRLVVILCLVEGYTLQEAAGILGIPTGTVKSRLHHAKEELRIHLSAMGIEL